MLDDQLRVVEWSNEATVALGVTEEDALGKSCYEVVRGHSTFGKPVCGPNCPPMRALRSGHVTARCSLQVLHEATPNKKFIAELVALPKPPGGALAVLVGREPTLLASSNGNSPVSSVSGRSATSTTDIVRDLATVATLATSLSPDHLDKSIELALDWLRQTTCAEAAELFMVEPQGGDMILSAYQGPFKAAFSQITRFAPGQGYPGLVLSRGEPILTSSLPEDSRFLRTQVKDKGFNSFACVPIFGSGGVVGILNVATRRSDLDLERTYRLLSWASRPIGTLLQGGLLQIRETVGVGPNNVQENAEQGLDDLLRGTLHQMMQVGNAAGGALVLYDRDIQGVVRQVTEGEFSGVLCPDIKSGTPQLCPVLTGGHGLALYGPRHSWPVSCHQVPSGASMVYCLPLVAGGQEVGIVQLGFTGRRPSPPTKYLPFLLNMAERVAPAIKLAWMNVQIQQLTQSRLAATKLELEQGTNGVASHTRPRLTDADSFDPASARPFLEIRSFGAFELYREGRLITPDMFNRRGALTLLKILLTHGGKPVSRDALSELLWPEADPQDSVNRLHVLVHCLRRVVEPFPDERRWVFICNDGDRYYFNLGVTSEARYQLDIKDFWDQVNVGEQQAREGDVPAAITAYEEAVNLYRGDLLEEEPYADWCWLEREHLKEVCLSILGRLATFYMEQNSPERSVDLYRQALRIDALREQSYRGLMRSLWAAKRRDEALREYQVCWDILQKDLGVEPLPETVELYHAIRAGRSP
ncbi:MAG: BTAD domain-containing putative transcriptional regulator [SAR202 cluster bacterium]|nr:BTAD domain-containing putative transcriptional regulator [SAR202 cluster bacterium]MDP6514010.1 BTAD domain-containing putative transcriptional regulator [SAR202 cluster bacterium]MDP6713451.1 BTAD domain-containing putative transcriptional regulator [SAR202 cluster bacterium]